MRPFRFLLSTLLAVLTGGLLGYAAPPALSAETAPRITSFRASSPSIQSGETVQLSWQLAGGQAATVRLTSASGVLTPTGRTVTLTPEISETYTLVVENRQGSDQQSVNVEVLGRALQSTSGGSVSGGAPTGSSASGQPILSDPVSGSTVSGGNASGGARVPTLPEGTFGVSLKADGPFLSDEAGGIQDPQDRRIVRVAAGGAFFAEVAYRDPEGIAGIDMMLVNSSPAGLSGSLSPTRRPFTVVGTPTGNCDLEARATAVRCRYRIRVGPNAHNISALPEAGSEFAYVFRVRVIDSAGTAVNKPVRGYVIVTPR